MRPKSILVASCLLLATTFLASAKTNNKTYDIHLYSAAVSGSSQLPAGEYKVKVEGDNAVLTNTDSHQQYTLPVTVQASSRKFEQTAVVTTDKDGATKLDSVEIGGSTTRLSFGN